MMYRALLPNMFTVGNLFCGFLAMHYVMQGKYIPAAWLIVLGAALDKLDGRIARMVGNDSDFGIEFDSLVDVCTFGLVPAFMVYHSLLRSQWGLTVAFIFLLCGALRLARYNITAKKDDEEKTGFFTGLPIPLAAVALSQYVVFTERSWETAHAATLGFLFVLALSFLMVSKVEYDAMPDFRSTAFWDRFKQTCFIVAIVLIILPSTSNDYFFPLVGVYLLSGLYRWIGKLISNEVAEHTG